ncbi:hypothetical protein PHYSODRAFT_497563 [Phytophthora sojae]|uniref:Cas12f1-like TNB domain-containing protein n=1 Tax=Phytophthora sojae (strain P6497) TaxID=1094619 RepID=G4Z3X6_PHYSP|nr:hypothetical protein PHYSODRAFT_497563 [Phytophthora sojae]EGZ21528.1 hypothetical protein PHYSODRAFT_497563 [Phytophthora sojae]|eukprot:XP_009524245.1 hypothetical protein PHYSODRAFT_497563 [Phytophthora sojae]
MSNRKRHHLGRHTGREWKQFVAARREFYTVTAKLDNYVKDLHCKAASHLCHNTDVILLPKFSTSSMLRSSAPWTHAFNDQMNTLAHHQFRQKLQAKCEVAGRAMVMCSEMYSSRTCGRCCRLHLTRRNEDVFRCPHYGFLAGRDENAAYNILRFVCAGSLSVYAVNGVAQLWLVV